MGGRKSKRSLSSRLSRKELDDNELAEAIAEIDHGSDRVAAIMASALVESALLSTICNFLEDDSDKRSLFFEQSSPFGTFHARIVAAQAFRVIDKEAADDLDTIKDIRNQFAHALRKIDFSNPDIVQWCNDLRDYPEWAHDREINEARKRYEDACFSLYVRIMQAGTKRLAKKAEELKREIAQRQGVAIADLLRGVAPGGEGGPEDVLNNMGTPKTGVED